MTEAEAPPTFDPFGITTGKVNHHSLQLQQQLQQQQQQSHEQSPSPRRAVLIAVSDSRKRGNTSHHSQRYAESHAAQSPNRSKPIQKSSSRTTNAGRLHSAEKQHLAALAVSKSRSVDSSVDPFGIAALTSDGGAVGVGGGGGGGDQVSSTSSQQQWDEMQPQSLEQRLDAARNGDPVVPIVLDPQTGRPAPLSRQTRGNSATSTSRALPPKMTIKLTLYEEVSAMALREEMVASQIAVEGSVYAQVQCSDALKNAPFTIAASKAREDTLIPLVKLRPNQKITSLEPIRRSRSGQRPVDDDDEDDNNDGLGKAYLVQVPKSELGFVPIIHYSFSQVVEHMPVLLERKVTIHETSCRIALQVRSKLTNRGDLKDFTLVVAIPEVVDGDSIEIIRGQGSYDALKRLIKFKLASLNKGESFMVSAQAKLWKAVRGTEVRFPVLLRCSSAEDQISTVDFRVQEADGSPCSISVTKGYSFRLLHRLT
ncbi:hypothetical protein ACA910_002440 [Epithemia clementina (nom. ined.)]